VSATKRLWITFWPAALAVGALAAIGIFRSDHDEQPWVTAALVLVAGWSFVAAGLVAWSRRPDNRVGRLMVAVGATLFLAALSDANEAWTFSIGLVFGSLFLAVFIHLLLAYPTGTLVTTAERVVVTAAYPVAILANLTLALVKATPNSDCEACPPNRLLLTDSDAAFTGLMITWDLAGAAFAVAVLVILWRRWRVATPAARRVLAPVFLSGTVTMVLLGIAFALEPAFSTAGGVFHLLSLLAFISVPYFFVAGLARGHLARAGVGRLFADVPENPSSAQLHDAFARVLHDPSVLLAHWLPEREAFVDLDGRPFELPPDDPRTWTLVEYEGRRVGAIVHDPTLLEQPGLLEAAVAAARIGLEKDRLAAELRARFVELERERDFIRTVVDASPALFCVLTPAGRIVRFNRSLEQLTGIADDEAVRGRFFWDVFLVPGKAEAAQVALSNPGPQYESMFRGQDGDPRTVVWSLTQLVDARGEPILLLTGTDVTERERQQEALRASEERSRALVEAIPDNMFRIRRDGTYIDFHANSPQTLLMPPHTIVGSHMSDHEGIPDWLVDLTTSAIERALDTGSLQTLEYHVAGSDREARMVPSGQDEVFMIVRDVTERKRQQEKLRASEERGRILLEAIPDIMFRIHRDGTIVDSHAHDPRELETGLKGTRGLNLWEIPQREIGRRIMECVEKALETGTLQTVEYDTGTTVREGRVLPSGPDEVVMISRDISDRKAAEDELRRSRARIVEAADLERRRLERNLHDGAQQRLVSLSLALRLAEAQLGRDPATAEQMLGEAQHELSEALADLRELARGIHPAILTDRGLGPALEALAARAPLDVELAAVPEERLPGPVEAAAYYVVAEGLTNVVKYAQASAVRVSIERLNGVARVEVADDGVGGADPASGTGLRGLADRIEALDGRLAVESPPGAGTRLRAEIPV
jgi:PAS domain S-box-containing protein